ncbi:MAG: CooT family nickel-binding protein [Anaerolineae bacterium]
MCQANVYLLRNGQKEEIVREATFLEVTEGGVRVATFFEEPRFVPAKVATVDFLKHVVTLVPYTEGSDENVPTR